jgi:hypothetical protein
VAPLGTEARLPFRRGIPAWWRGWMCPAAVTRGGRSGLRLAARRTSAAVAWSAIDDKIPAAVPNDLATPGLGELDWHADSRTASLSAVFAHAIGVVTEAQTWYASKRPSKRAWGRALRVTAILLGTAGAVLPIVSQITSTSGKPAIAPGWSAVAVAAALACIGLDRYFGFSSGWMRFMAADQRLARQRSDFEYSWNQIRAGLTDPPTDEDVNRLLELARANVLAVQDIIGAETSDWLADFRGALSEAEQTLTVRRP